jgi:hypothetical protein
MAPSKSDRIAICGDPFPRSLKQQLLFFDRIGVFKLDQVIKTLRNLDRSPQKVRLRLKEPKSKIDFVGPANDMEFLQSKNIVFDPGGVRLEFVTPDSDRPSSSYSLFDDDSDEHDDDDSDEHVDATASEDYDDMQSLLLIIEKQLANKTKDDQFPLYFYRARYAIAARMLARNMQKTNGLEVSALHSEPLTLPKKTEGLPEVQTVTKVVDVVLDRLPMPSELTPWEAILDFKADTEAQGYLQGLKVWMGETARQKLTATEASEKLDWLLFQHKKHLEAHKLSCRWGTLGGTFVAAAEILEDLVKIKWGKAAGAIVSIVDRRLQLLDAERSSPAKEISYIVKAQERFED